MDTLNYVKSLSEQFFFRHADEYFATSLRTGEEGWIPYHVLRPFGSDDRSKYEYVKIETLVKKKKNKKKTKQINSDRIINKSNSQRKQRE